MSNKIPFDNSSFNTIRIRFLMTEKAKSKIQVGDAKPKGEAKYPFFTSGESILSFDEFLCDNQTIFLNTGGNASVKFYNGKASYSTDTYAIKSKNENFYLTKFLFYCLNDIKFMNDIYFEGSALKHLQKNKFKNFRIPYPPIDEQEKIVEFLDKKCEIIDERLENLEQKIQSLKEYKKSLISECVTKGLNSKILEFKDSGIPWIGKIPKHWEVSKIKYCFKLSDKKNYLPLDEVLLLSLYADLGVFPRGEEEEKGNKATTADGYKIVKKNDIVVNIILAWMGSIGMSNYDGVTSPAYDIYSPNENKVFSKFYHYLFRTDKFAGECYKYGRGIMAMRWRTYSSEFKNFKIPLPPLDEQERIAEFLDKKCASIDKLSANYQSQIATLKEYKKSLIYECVTGKKEIKICYNFKI